MFTQKYEKVKLLGEGAFGAAYLVRPRSKQGAVQVAKEIRVGHLTDKQRDGALAESEVLKMMQQPCNHPNIVAYIESMLEGPRLFIIMEYADGGDVAMKIKERKESSALFKEREVMFIFVQLASALLHIHARKVLHRDLKPLNIFLTKKGIVKLGDFGIARVLESSTAIAQTTIGSPYYLSPEMINSEPYGVKSDIWALGVVTYELTALKVPFHANCLPAVALKICGAEPDPLPDGFSDELAWIIFSFLNKEPQQRPRLDLVVRKPFVQKYVQVLLSHTLKSGTGGCENMLRNLQGGEAGSKDEPINHRVSERQSDRQPERQSDRQPETQSERQSERHCVKQPIRKSSGIERHDPRMQAPEWEGSRNQAMPIPSRVPTGQDEPTPQVRVSAVVRERGRVAQELVAQREKAAAHKARMAHEQFVQRRQQALQAEFMTNRQSAMENKRRVESQTRSMFALQCCDGEGYTASGMVERYTDDAAATRLPTYVSQDLPSEGERRIAEVKRRGQQERDAQMAQRQRELDQAMQEAQEQKRLARLRVLDRHSRENLVHDAADQDEQVVESQNAEFDCAATLPTAEALDLTQRVEPSTAVLNDASPTAAVNMSSNRPEEVAGNGNTCSPAQASSGGAEVDVGEWNNGLICVSMTDKVRPRPKLSSERTQPRRGKSFAESCDADMDAPPSEKNMQKAQGKVTPKKERKSPGLKPLEPVNDNVLVQAQQTPPGVQDKNVTSSRQQKVPPARASGAPARWLRAHAGLSQDGVMDTLPPAHAHQPQVEGKLSGGKVIDVAPLSAEHGKPEVLRSPANLLQPPTPKGNGEVSKLQDALANMLCSVEGRRSALSEQTIPEEIAVATLRMSRGFESTAEVPTECNTLRFMATNADSGLQEMQQTLILPQLDSPETMGA